MASPPAKCLRGIVRIPAAGAAIIGSNLDVPIAAFMWDSAIGDKQELQYQRADGVWVDISANSPVPGISEGVVWTDSDPSPGGRVYAVNEINTIGVKEWTVRNFQNWATANLYAFFKPLMQGGGTGGGPTTEGSFVTDVNASLADQFIFLDTNADGIPEFHGK